MKFSGIWDDFFIPQVQVVAYFHKWKWSEERGGEFAYWLPNENGDVGSATLVKPLSGWGSTVDGSRVVHAANTYYPKREPPLIDKSKDIELRYEEELKMWTVYEDGVRTIFEYDNEELRQTLVFRARCFESEEAKVRFKMLSDSSLTLINVRCLRGLGRPPPRPPRPRPHQRVMCSRAPARRPPARRRQAEGLQLSRAAETSGRLQARQVRTRTTRHKPPPV